MPRGRQQSTSKVGVPADTFADAEGFVLCFGYQQSYAAISPHKRCDFPEPPFVGTGHHCPDDLAEYDQQTESDSDPGGAASSSFAAGAVWVASAYESARGV